MSRFFSLRAGLGVGLAACMVLLAGCAPRIMRLVPPRGQPGTLVTIQGQRFGATAAQKTIKFGEIAVNPTDVVSASPTSIQARVPAGARTGLVSVTTSKGTGISPENFIITGSAKWTFMVYLDADNNLEGAGLADYREMATVGSSAALNIVVQMDRRPGYASGDGDWTGTRRFLVPRNGTPALTPLADLGEQNMGDPNTLRDFVEWAVDNYPAERYALVIWNHGGGWRQMMERLHVQGKSARERGQPDLSVARAVASDDTDNDQLFMKEVQTALESARDRLRQRNNTMVKLDLVGFDACLMGMVEVAYALRDVANYVVGSEETEPANGWPYNTILADLAANPSMPPRGLASAIVARYGAAYNSGVTQSAFDLASLNDLTTSIDAFAAKANGEWAQLKAARLGSRQYHPAGFAAIWGVDLWDFADRVHNSVNSADIKTVAADLKKALSGFVVAEHHSSNMAGSHGVAIYFPPTKTEYANDPEHTGYEENNTFMPVDFVIHHQWDNWLRTYYGSIP